MDLEHNSDIRVLVTGASGFISSHCVQLLLEQGYKVRGTVRDLSNGAKVQPLRDLKFSERLELVEADLTDEPRWTEVVEGCVYVLHIASPCTVNADSSIISTSVRGTLSVLRASSICKCVKKVVITSSCVAINEGHDSYDKVFTEDDWTNCEMKTTSNYTKSKTMAERVAWEYVTNNKDVTFKLTTLNPVLVVGPLLNNLEGISVKTVRRILNREIMALPQLSLALVDVRDVAKAHVVAMREPKSDGHRILLAYQPSFWLSDIATILHNEFSLQGYSVPRLSTPFFLLWVLSFFSELPRSILNRIGKVLLFDNSKAKKLLNIELMNPATSLIEMAYDMIERGIITKKPAYIGRATAPCVVKWTDESKLTA